MPLPSLARRWLVLAFKLAVLALVLWGGHRTVAQAIEGLREQGWTFDRLQPGWLALAGGLYLTSQLPCGLFWARVLREMGQRLPTSRVLRAYYIGHLGKYVPGKAMVPIIRVGLIKTPQTQTGVAVAAMFYETLTTMAIGGLVAGAMLLIGHRDQWHIALVSLCLGLALGAPTSPLVFNALLRVLRKNAPRRDADALPMIDDAAPSADLIPRLRPARLAAPALAIAAGWLVMGLCLWAVVRGMGVVDPGPWDGLTLYTAASALAVVAGFVSLLPGGLVVREVAIGEILAPVVGPTVAIGSALLMRLVTLTSELLLAAVLYPLGRRLHDRRAESEVDRVARPSV